MADGGMIEVARATVTIIPNMSGMQGAITSGMSGAGAKGSAALGASMVSGLGKFKGRILGALGTAAIAKGLYDIATEFDKMRDTIIAGTGASGEALDGLVESAKGIATSVPTSFSEAGETVQELNTRLGLTGESLEDVGKRVQALGKITGEKFDTEKFAGAMAAWGESTDKMADDLDTLFAVSQSTGIGMSDLTGIVENMAPTMKTLGYSFEDTAAMAGLLDKAGLDAKSTMSKMSRAMTVAAKDGEKPAEAMKRVTTEIGEYIKAGDDAAALDLASQLFGTRGAAQFVAAVKSGAMDVEDFAKAVSDSGGIIDETLQQTMSLPEQMTIMKNKLMEILQPLATPLFDALGDAMDRLLEKWDSMDTDAIADTMSKIGTALGNMLGFVVEHPEVVATLVGIVGALKLMNGLSGATGLMSMLGGIGGKAGGAGMAQAAKMGMSPAGIAKGMAGIGIIIGSMAGIVVAFGALKQVPGFDDLMAGGAEEIKKIFDVIGSMASFASAGFVAAIVGLGMAGVGTAASGMAALAAIIGGMTAVCAAYGALRMIPGFDDLINDGAEGLISVFESIGAMIGALAEGFAVELSNAFPEIGSNLGKFAENAKPFFDAAADTDVAALGSFVDGVASLSGMSMLQQLDFGESELSKLGTNLADFAANVKPFFTNAASIGDMSAGNKLLKSAENFKSLSQVSAGSSGLMGGESKLEKLAKQLSAFAAEIKPFYDTATQISDYSAGSNLLKEAENFGKLAGVKNDGANLPEFGDNLVKFADSAKVFFEKMSSVQGSGLDFEPVMNTLQKLSGSISDSGKKVSSSISDMNSQAVSKLGSMKSSFSSNATSIGSAARSIGTRVRASLKSVPDAVVSATSRTKTELSKLSNAFSNVKFNMKKHIDLPHFTMTGNFDAKTKKVPTVSVSGWYAKGAIATAPSIVGVGEGKYDEALLPLSPKVLAGIGEGIQGGGDTFNITMNVDGARNPEEWATEFARGLRRQVRMGVI